MGDTLDDLLILARRRLHVTGIPSSRAVVESLLFSKRWEAGGFDPDDGRRFSFRLHVDAIGDAVVTVHGRVLPIDADAIGRRFREAGVDLLPGLRLLLTPELAAEFVEGALDRIARAGNRFDWALAALNLRLSLADSRRGAMIRDSIESVERAVNDLRRGRVMLLAARAALRSAAA